MTPDCTEILEGIREPYGLGADATARPLGQGHINTTVLVSDGPRRLVAQKVNKFVFPQPERLVRNALRVAALLERVPDAPRIVNHLPDASGQYLHGRDGNLRVLEFIPGSVTASPPASPEQARMMAFAFARFAGALIESEPAAMETVIPNFHSPAHRLEQFRSVVDLDRADRASPCREEIQFVLSRAERVQQWQELLDSLPLRICHNDCKPGNLLLDGKSAGVLAIIDLDTCMPGRLTTEFGDLVRSSCNPEAEDDPGIAVQPEILSKLREGYIAGFGDGMTDAERSSLELGGLVVSFIQGVRFLTDYLDGDRYFRVSHDRQNLDRARNQFRLYLKLSAVAAS